jgi:hypothetical protein
MRRHFTVAVCFEMEVKIQVQVTTRLAGRKWLTMDFIELTIAWRYKASLVHFEELVFEPRLKLTQRTYTLQ